MPTAGKERLIFPLDVPTAAEALELVDLLDDRIGVFKIGLELFCACGPAIVEQVAARTRAGIFLDLKLHDIPATVGRALAVLTRLPGVAFLTVHCDQGRGLLEAVVRQVPPATRVLAVTVLTSLDQGDLEELGVRPELARDPAQLVLRKAIMAKKAACGGVVCSGREAAAVKDACGPDFLVVTPGIRPAWQHLPEDDQKRAVTPYEAVAAGADYIVVGRPIRTAADPRAAAARVADEIAKALQLRSP